MRFSRERLPQLLFAMTMLSSLSDVQSTPLERLAGGMSLSLPGMMLGLFVATLKLSVAGRVLGVMSDWFVNSVPAGIAVRKDVVDDSALSTPEDKAAGEIDETRLERLKTRIAQIYRSLVSIMKSENREKSPAHRVSRREATESNNGTEDRREQIHNASVDIPLSDDEINGNTPIARTFGRNRCVLKLVCQYEDQGSSREESYPARAARYVSDFWERYRPNFLDYFFGDEKIALLARTDYGVGCFLHHNSCPMRIVNVVMLATSLQRLEEKSAEA